MSFWKQKCLYIYEKTHPTIYLTGAQILMSWRASLSVEMKWDHSKVQLPKNHVAVTFSDFLPGWWVGVQKVEAVKGSTTENCFASQWGLYPWHSVTGSAWWNITAACVFSLLRRQTVSAALNPWTELSSQFQGWILTCSVFTCFNRLSWKWWLLNTWQTKQAMLEGVWKMGCSCHSMLQSHKCYSHFSGLKCS